MVTRARAGGMESLIAKYRELVICFDKEIQSIFLDFHLSPVSYYAKHT